MSKTKRVLNWVAWHLAALVFFYFGWLDGEGAQGARNVFLFMVWVTFAVSLMLSSMVQQGMRARGRAVPAWLDASYDVVLVGLMVFHGLWISAVAFAFAATLQYGVYATRETAGPAP